MEWADFEKAYFEHGTLLYHFIRRRVRCAELAKDILHDVYVRLWEHRGRLDPDKSVKSYLFKIASNLVIDHLRKNNRGVSSLEDDLASSSRPDHILEVQEKIETLLCKMSPKIKNVFIMSRLDGFSYKEMADICGVSVKTIEAWMGKAIKIMSQERGGD